MKARTYYLLYKGIHMSQMCLLVIYIIVHNLNYLQWIMSGFFKNNTFKSLNFFY